MNYLTLADIEYIHAELIHSYGGSSGIRDRGMIEAALLRPQTGYYRDLIEEAAALWESLTMNHGFFDGNKRVAFAAMEIFLDLNGFELRATEKHAISLVYGLLESSNFNKNELESWLRTYAHRL